MVTNSDCRLDPDSRVDPDSRLELNSRLDPGSRLDLVFGALADPTRRAILARLTDGQATVGELAAPFPVSRPAISRHLDVLERAGLIHRMADGRRNLCRFDAEPLADAAALLERYRSYWTGQFDALADYLETEDDDEHAG